ncbi:hypothetical protein IWQ61_007475 [Dispira simplex]|nr:hypothetical protein IWQ61_007475 [Dispira simplex]
MSKQTNQPMAKPPSRQAREAEPEMTNHTNTSAFKSDLTESTSFQAPEGSSETESEMTHNMDVSDMELDTETPTSYQALEESLGFGSAMTPNSDTVGVESDTTTSISSFQELIEPTQPPRAQPSKRTNCFKRWFIRLFFIYVLYVVVMRCPEQLYPRVRPDAELICQTTHHVHQELVQPTMKWLLSTEYGRTAHEYYANKVDPFYRQHAEPSIHQVTLYYSRYFQPRARVFWAKTSRAVKGYLDPYYRNYLAPTVEPLYEDSMTKYITLVKPHVDRVSAEWQRFLVYSHALYVQRVGPAVRRTWRTGKLVYRQQVAPTLRHTYYYHVVPFYHKHWIPAYRKSVAYSTMFYRNHVVPGSRIAATNLVKISQYTYRNYLVPGARATGSLAYRFLLETLQPIMHGLYRRYLGPHVDRYVDWDKVDKVTAQTRYVMSVAWKWTVVVARWTYEKTSLILSISVDLWNQYYYAESTPNQQLTLSAISHVELPFESEPMSESPSTEATQSTYVPTTKSKAKTGDSASKYTVRRTTSATPTKTIRSTSMSTAQATGADDVIIPETPSSSETSDTFTAVHGSLKEKKSSSATSQSTQTTSVPSSTTETAPIVVVISSTLESTLSTRTSLSTTSVTVSSAYTDATPKTTVKKENSIVPVEKESSSTTSLASVSAPTESLSSTTTTSSSSLTDTTVTSASLETINSLSDLPSDVTDKPESTVTDTSVTLSTSSTTITALTSKSTATVEVDTETKDTEKDTTSTIRRLIKSTKTLASTATTTATDFGEDLKEGVARTLRRTTTASSVPMDEEDVEDVKKAASKWVQEAKSSIAAQIASQDNVIDVSSESTGTEADSVDTTPTTTSVATSSVTIDTQNIRAVSSSSSSSTSTLTTVPTEQHQHEEL